VKKPVSAKMQKAYDPLEVGLPAVEWIERLILGMALANSQRMDEFAATVQVDDFSTEANKLLWVACAALNASGVPVTPHAAASELSKYSQLEIVGIGYIADVFSGTIPNLPNPSRYIKTLRDYGQRRRSIFRSNEIMIEASLPECDSAALLMGASESFARMAADLNPDSDFKSPAQILEDFGGINKYAAEQYSESVITTPLRALNSVLITGGFIPGDLVILAGHTSRGKSALAVNIALHACQRGKKVVFISLEMPEQSIYDRFVSLIGNLDGYALHKANENMHLEAERRSDIRASIGHLNELPIKINYRPGLSPKVLLSELRRIQAVSGVDLVIVDYLQLMSGGEKFGNKTEEVTHISRSLKRIAGELSVPIVALSQFSRESAKQEREPRLDDLRESGSIEQDATLVLLLHVTRMWDIQSGVYTADAKLIVAKQRNGISGTWIPLTFHVQTGRFEDQGYR